MGLWKVNVHLFCKFSIHKYEWEPHFFKMMWKIHLYLPIELRHLNHHPMHFLDLTQNLEYLSLVKRYSDFKLYPQIALLKINTWRELYNTCAWF